MNILPKTAVPSYKMIVPSLDKEVTYRPYLVKEEKILYVALESADVDQIQQAVVDVIKECVDLPVKATSLPTYDIEYMFLMLRSKSVGERVKLQRPCEECGHINEIDVDLEKISVDKPERDDMVEVSKDFIIKMKEMSLSEVPEQLEDDRDHVIKTAARSIDKIYHKDETYYSDDFSQKELEDFVLNLTTNQFQAMVDYIINSPSVVHHQDVTCVKCGYKTEVEFQGLLDFFI